jgi:amino acid transporter
MTGLSSARRPEPTLGRGPYHPRTAHHRNRARGQLRLRDASAMAIGGMIGGGIFSVLGVTIQLAGHLAFACFVLAGLVALVTAHSYVGLTRRSGTSGGPYSYLCAEGHPQLAALTSWFLVLGYVLALAVYAFTFGHYVGALLGGNQTVTRTASLVVLVLFWALNTRGLGASSITEDVVVLAKLVVLAGIAGIGLLAWAPSRLIPLADTGYAGLFVGAAAIFVAYEGFELLSYDYDDIDDPERTLPRALYLSIVVVIGIYVVVTLGSQMLVSDQLIVARREVAFAAVGQQALGTVGRWVATGAAVLATSSAINATLFSTARLVGDLSDAGELPAGLGRTVHGVPVRAMGALAVLAGLFAMLPAINDLLAFGSLTFLGVFGLIDHLHARTAVRRTEQLLGHVGSAACAAAVVVTVGRLAIDAPLTLALVAGCVLTVTVLRALHVRSRIGARRTT